MHLWPSPPPLSSPQVRERGSKGKRFPSDAVSFSAAVFDVSVVLVVSGDGTVRVPFKPARFAVIGHRGSGMNKLCSADRRMKAIKENTILSFDAAARFAVDFVEFDVQVSNAVNFSVIF